jgi:hypothetical protein
LTGGSSKVGRICSSNATPLLQIFFELSRKKKLNWGRTVTMLWQNLQPV